MVRERIAIQWVSTDVQFQVLPPIYIPLNLQPEMKAGSPRAKSPRYFGPAADSEQPGNSGIRAQTHPF